MNAAVARLEDDAGAELSDMLRKSVQDFAAVHPGVARTRRHRDLEPGYDPTIWGAMAQAGWTGIAIPEASGGLDLGLAEICIVAEELAADLAPEPFGPATVAALAIARGDKPALRERILPRIVSGDILPALAWQEDANTIDALAPSARLMPIPYGRFMLSGTKRFVPAAAGATGFAVTVATADGPSIVWVARGAPGLSMRGDLCVDGSWLHTVVFDGVELTPGDVIASTAATGPLLARLVDEAAVIGAAELLGVIRAAFDRTHSYLGQRTQFGRPIGSFQVLQHRLVDLWMQRELVRALLGEAIEACAGDDPEKRARAASAVKAKASAAALANSRQSIQLHGAIGYADEHDIGLYLKRAIVKSAWMGGAPVHRRRLARLYGYSGQE